MAGFSYFVILADMRTGSNLLEETLNSCAGLTCHGELFNPNFFGQPNRDTGFGLDMDGRERDPVSVIHAMCKQSGDLPGFRLFSDHDPRVLQHVLDDPSCAKIVLSRNPIDSYISLRIASETGQWRLSDLKQRKTAKARFDADDFDAYLAVRAGWHATIKAALQKSGQTAFYLDYDDLPDLEIISGLVRYLGYRDGIEALPRKLKRQNPGAIEEKVENYADMVAALRGLDPFGLSRDFLSDTKRGPQAKSLLLGQSVPLLLRLVPGGPTRDLRAWFSQFDTPIEGVSQRDLRTWQKAHPGYLSIAVIRHPFLRALAGFEMLVRQDRLGEIKRRVQNRYGVTFPEASELAPENTGALQEAFGSFLRFLKGNLASQTSIGIQPFWATQSSLLEGGAQLVLPEIILHETDFAPIGAFSQRLGCDLPGFDADARLGELAMAIHDPELENLCQSVYRRDYIGFGFREFLPG